MTSIKPRRSLLVGTERAHEGVDSPTLERIKAENISRINDLQSVLFDMQKKVSRTVSKGRTRQIRAHNRETNVVQANFTVGDFFLVRRAQDKGHNMSFRWLGQCRITNVVSDLVYDVTKLDGPNTERVHCARLQLYRSSDENSAKMPTLLELAERTEAKYELVVKMHDIGENKDGLFFHVERSGLPDKRDWTWTPLQ